MRGLPLRKEMRCGSHNNLRLCVLQLLASLCIWAGNLAINKPAYQSSTFDNFSADYAVNGIFPPPGEISTSNCSHTVESREDSNWWFVSLSETEDFVLKNVTIVNRQGPKAQALRNFYILYTNETTGYPNLTSWKTCTHNPGGQTDIVATYTCSTGTAIGRRVAIYLGFDPQSNAVYQLALCEVFVNGYAYKGNVDATKKISGPFAFSTPTVYVSAFGCGYVVAVIVAALLAWRKHKAIVQQKAMRYINFRQTEVVNKGNPGNESAYMSLDEHSRQQDDYCNLTNNA